MELVYLWVEDYKNIQKQGFNFSPRFECEFKDEYDEEGRLKDDCELKINKKDEYVNIFPENINVTAIVGENGSGKSSIQKIIFMLIYYNKFLNIQNTSKTEHYYRTINNLKYKYKNKVSFLVLKDNKGMYKNISFNANIKYNIECSELKDTEIDFFSVYFNYIFDTWYNEFADEWINHIYHKTDGYATPLLLQPNKQDSNTLSAIVNIDTINYLNEQNILKFYEDITGFKSITNFFKPNILKIKNIPHSINYSTTLRSNYVELLQTSKIGSQILKIAAKYNFKLNHNDDNKLLKELKKLEENKDFEYINQLYISCKILLSNNKLFDKNIYNRTKANFQNMIKEDTLISKENLVQSTEFVQLIKSEVSEYEVAKIKKCFKFQDENILNSDIFKDLFDSKELDLHKQEVKNILNSIPPWLDIDFYEDAKSLSTLSSGEKALFTIISNIMYQFNNIHEDDKYGTINIFLDETELGVHPKWQKEYLANIIKSIMPLNDKNKKINLYFATHSPFLLSDLPKENVIFLDKFKKDDDEVKKELQKIDNCKNVSKTIDINPFGANIHTLLSHGFFMKDGLMGDFAKNKIQNVINFINDKESDLTKKDIYPIIELIGEPFLKQKLKEQYFTKYPEERDIDNEIDILEKKLTELKNAKNSK